MVDIVKQDMTYLWAVSGDVVAPDNAKIQEGWAVEVVPRQWWNWMQYRADSNIAYMLQKGLPEWDATTEYNANKSFVTSGGVVYKCLVTNTGLAPLTNPTQWARAFADYTTSLAALGSITPAADRLPYFNGSSTATFTTLTSFARTLLDDTTNTAARTTLGAQASHANLTALSGVTAAVNTFPYWTSTTAMAAAPITAFARTILDDADAAAVRATLGLGTAATATLTTSTTDSTTGSVLRVGDWGMAGSIQGVPIPGNDVDTIVYTGFYNITGATVNGPVGFGSGSTIQHVAWASTGAYHQLAFNYTNGTQMAFRRRHSTNGWGAWNTITTSADLQSALSAIGLNSTASVTVSDLDAVTLAGNYRFTSTANGIPAAGLAGTLIHNAYDVNYASQIVLSLSGTDATKYNRMFTRTRNNGTWGPWKESVVTESPTINNATMTGTTTVPTNSTLKVGNSYTDLTGAALFVNNTQTTGASGITIQNFAPTLAFVDQSASAVSSRFRMDGNVLRYDSSTDNGANWNLNTMGITQTGSIGVVGSLGVASIGLEVGLFSPSSTTLTGLTQIGVRSRFTAGADATSAVIGFASEGAVGNGTTTATTTNLIDFQANSQVVNTNHTITTASCFRANDKNSTQVATAFGFHGLVALRAGVARWNIYAAGTAPNYMNGQTIIGGSATLPAANVSLQVNGDQVVSGTLSAATLTATTINATTLNATNFAPTNVNTTGNVTAAGFITAGSYISTNGTLETKAGTVYVQAQGPSDNSHVWFKDSSGNTTGILYSNPSGTVTLQAGSTVAAVFNSAGQASFNGVGSTTLAATQGITNTAPAGLNPVQIVSIKSGVPVNASMYQNCGFQSQTTDGSPPGYGFHRAGSYAVSLYLSAANELEIMDSGGNNRQVVNSQNLPVWMAANSGAGAVGSYALMLLGGGGSGILPGTNIAGANLRYSAASSSNNGTTATGTWRVMGYVVNADFSDSDSVTLCMRIA